MCGFVVSKYGQVFNDTFVKRRGPDVTGRHSLAGFDFYHYLLHITGEKTPQPFVDDDIVCVFNGEIYNHPFVKSDGENIIPLYKKYGEDFARHLDGEYAIAIYDFHQQHALFVTDPFGTKPLFVNGATCASYRSCLGGEQLRENSVLVKSLRTGAEKTIKPFVFDFDNQFKNSYQDWIAAFECSVTKRATRNCFIGLSSGYDSGALACELLKQGVPFEAYSVRGSEEINTLEKRASIAHAQVFHLSRGQFEESRQTLRATCEPYRYDQAVDFPLHCKDMFDCGGAIGGAFIFNHANKRGKRVYLSGQGADEILADYCLTNRGTHFNGVFPDKLYEWPNFHNGCQRVYLSKDEYVGGAYGIECRYPFLDTALVQEFLWLSAELKNAHYKAPLHEYLTLHSFPFVERVKEGFAAEFNLSE